MNLGVIFITGLTVGGLTCLAVQGGLLASVIAARDEDIEAKTGNRAVFITAVFLLAKLCTHILLGALLGVFGGAISISSSWQTIMQLIAGLYMIAIALNLLNVHPLFRYAVIQPPRFLTRMVKTQSKSKAIFAPALLGAMTIFIPCGTTLAMEALSISSAHPLSGALIMGAFILGTIPVFLGIGFITSLLSETMKKHFLRVTAIAVLYLGITSTNGALIALDFPFTSVFIKDSYRVLTNSPAHEVDQLGDTTQNPEIIITGSGYSPQYIRVKHGIPVTITLKSKDAYSCASAFRIPSLGIKKDLQANETATVTFTPEKLGKITFTCSMGMYTGVIEVV